MAKIPPPKILTFTNSWQSNSTYTDYNQIYSPILMDPFAYTKLSKEVKVADPVQDSTQQTIDELLESLRSRKKVKTYKATDSDLLKQINAIKLEAGMQTLPPTSPKRPGTLGSGDAAGGYALIDQEHNIVDIWNELKEEQAIDRFNELWDELKAGKRKFPTKVKSQVWLLAIDESGQSAGVLGVLPSEF